VRSLLIAVAAISFFDRSYTQLMPLFARDVFNAGAQGLGLLLAMPAVGTIVVALFLAGGSNREHRGLEVIVSSAALGLALVGFAASSNLWLSLVLLVVVGGAATAASALVNTLLLEKVSDEMHGRVMAFYMDATQGASQLGALPMGVLAQAVGAPLAVDVSAAISLLVVGALALRARALRLLD